METEVESLWRSVCGELSVTMSPGGFLGWVKPCYIRSITPLEGGKVIVELATPSTYHMKTVDEKYYGQIKAAIEKIGGKKCELALVIDSKPKEVIEQKQDTQDNNPKIGLFQQTDQNKQQGGTNLNPRYTFDSYVVGSSNQLAYAAAQAVTKYPGTRHNPLFIWGGVGVGKTHLMHGVGHELVKKGVGKVVFISSEQFTNDLVSSLRSKMVEAFKRKYRQVGALLIDDVQFFSGKDSTQEEFFHTFNELTNKGVQIVMTADRKPQEILGLEDRLRSRFLGGMTVDVGLPDYEMRVAILKQKAAELMIEADNDAYELIAESFATNIRELEGTFVRMATMAGLSGGILSREMVQQTLGLPSEKLQRVRLRPVKVISVVAKYFGFKNKDLIGQSRKADLVLARHITMHLLRDDLGMQLARIGELLGGRDHTTVLHATEKIDFEVKNNVDVRRKVMAVKQALYTKI